MSKLLVGAKVVGSDEGEAIAHAIYAANAGAQLLARGCSGIAVFDAMIDSYRTAVLLPD